MSELVPPLIITDVNTITSFEINSVSVKLNQSAEVLVYLKNSDNVIVASEMVVIEGVDYQAWGSDDQYIVNYINNYLRSNYSI
jgi:hypothetical protein